MLSSKPLSRWFTGTLFPLIAGTFGPLATVFNICASAEPWRLIVSPQSRESEGRSIPDPHWLVAVHVTSMPIATLANVALFVHMVGKMRFEIAIPAVITGWCISGSIVIGLIAATPAYAALPAYPTATYSQAYYYAIFAGALYFVLSGVLAITSYGLWKGQRKPHIELSRSQGRLIVYTLIFLGYILGSAGIYSGVEPWSYLDAFYFVVVTIYTIGFGDYSPQTHLGRSLLFPLGTLGILLTGLIIAKISAEVSTAVPERSLARSLKRNRRRAATRNALVVEPPAHLECQTTTEQHLPRDLGPARSQSDFQLMRNAQARALLDKRMRNVTLSAVAFFSVWLIGAVVFWQAEKAIGGQNWTYFESLYFTYTAQFTIGYGSLAPQTNSSKPAFVFWSMLTLPIFTVLLSAVGDAISSFVDWVVQWIRAHARWPIEPSPVIFGDRVQTRGTKTRHPDGREMTTVSRNETAFEDLANIDAEILAVQVPHNTLSGAELFAADNFHHVGVALQAAMRLLDDLSVCPPRRYTYQEWSWLLKLLTEIESKIRHSRESRSKSENEIETTERSLEWDWMSPQSPLIAEDTEAKYMLKQLLPVLQDYMEEGEASQRQRRI